MTSRIHEHLAHDFEAQAVVEREPRLIEQLVGARATRLPGAIESHTSLTDPYQQSAHTSGQCTSRVRHARTGFQHQASHLADRNVRANARFIDYDESSVEHVELAAFDIENRQAVLDRDGFQWRSRAGVGSYSSARRAPSSTISGARK